MTPPIETQPIEEPTEPTLQPTAKPPVCGSLMPSKDKRIAGWGYLCMKPLGHDGDCGEWSYHAVDPATGKIIA